MIAEYVEEVEVTKLSHGARVGYRIAMWAHDRPEIFAMLVLFSSHSLIMGERVCYYLAPASSGQQVCAQNLGSRMQMMSGIFGNTMARRSLEWFLARWSLLAVRWS